ncbi:hypothetical protein HK098_003746 [Nowakowskiella sp. JEL0407]|nr:hypothetical protein HK098_003746 [Nowakowskiella sp. JEL0407]
MLNLFDFEALAQKILSSEAWAYYSSGSDDEITLRENHSAFQRIWLKPRVMINVRNVNTETKILGIPSSLPIYISATALGKLGHPEGEVVLTRAAGTRKIIQMIPTLASCSLEEMTAAKIPGQSQFFQLYVNPDRKVTADLIRRAEKQGCKGLFITVDAPQLGRREKDMRMKFVDDAPDVQSESSVVRNEGAARAISSFIDSGLCWDDIPWFKSITKMPIVLKGVQCAEDAVLAARHGCAGIVISNHGGRQLDTTPSAIEILPTVMDALRKENLNDKLEVYIDGGIRRGSDIVKALALGATAVGLGRPFLYGMSTYGQQGVERVIDLLRDELEMNMRLMGATQLSQIVPAMVDISSLSSHDTGVPRDFLSKMNYTPLTSKFTKKNTPTHETESPKTLKAEPKQTDTYSRLFDHRMKGSNWRNDKQTKMLEAVERFRDDHDFNENNFDLSVLQPILLFNLKGDFKPAYACANPKPEDEYIALSHCWGDSQLPTDVIPTWEEYISKADEYKERVVKMLKDVGFGSSEWFWNDYICENQSDKFARRDLTVSLSQIYATAKQTVVLTELENWLNSPWTIQECFYAKNLRFVSRNKGFELIEVDNLNEDVKKRIKDAKLISDVFGLVKELSFRKVGWECDIFYCARQKLNLFKGLKCVYDKDVWDILAELEFRAISSEEAIEVHVLANVKRACGIWFSTQKNPPRYHQPKERFGFLLEELAEIVVNDGVSEKDAISFVFEETLACETCTFCRCSLPKLQLLVAVKSSATGASTTTAQDLDDTSKPQHQVDKTARGIESLRKLVQKCFSDTDEIEGKRVYAIADSKRKRIIEYLYDRTLKPIMPLASSGQRLVMYTSKFVNNVDSANSTEVENLVRRVDKIVTLKELKTVKEPGKYYATVGRWVEFVIKVNQEAKSQVSGKGLISVKDIEKDIAKIDLVEFSV